MPRALITIPCRPRLIKHSCETFSLPNDGHRATVGSLRALQLELTRQLNGSVELQTRSMCREVSDQTIDATNAIQHRHSRFANSPACRRPAFRLGDSKAADTVAVERVLPGGQFLDC